MSVRTIPFAVLAACLVSPSLRLPAEAAFPPDGPADTFRAEALYGMVGWNAFDIAWNGWSAGRSQETASVSKAEGGVPVVMAPLVLPAFPLTGRAIINDGILVVSREMSLNNQVGTAQTAATGIAGHTGTGSIVNTGTVQVTTGAAIDVLDFTVQLANSGEAGRQALTMASGITTGGGKDKVTSTGVIDVEASAAVDSLAFDLALIGTAAEVDTSSLARSGAVGVSGGNGVDRIDVSGSTTVTALAVADSDQVTMTLLPLERLSASVGADATASGIVEGRGCDTIIAAGTLQVVAEAEATTLAVQISAAEIASGETGTWSRAAAKGIDDGFGRNNILNTSAISVRASASTTSTGVSLSFADLSLISDLMDGESSADTSITSTAAATGISAGSGRDTIVNRGDVMVIAEADTATFDLAWSAYGISNPMDITEFLDYFTEEPVIDAGSTAEAAAIGISSAGGNDFIDNSATVTARATAEADAGSVNVDFPLPDLIPLSLPEIDTSEVATASSAQATGIATGEGYDDIVNTGAVITEATAMADSWSVGVSLQPSLGGDEEPSSGWDWFPSLSANLVDVGAQAEAVATGIDSGGGKDRLLNAGSVTATATADASATDVEVTLEQADDKLSAGLSLANASTEGTATATGISTGAGNDEIVTSGVVLANTVAGTTSTTVNVDVSILDDTKVALGAIVTSANTEATAHSTGIDAGSGNDVIRVTGRGIGTASILQVSDSVSASALGDADSVGVIVDVAASPGKDFSLVGEGAWARADTLANAAAEGISGGEGTDSIRNEGSVVADAQADALSVGVAVTAAGTKKGASLGVALTQAKSEAEAVSVAIGGGADQDEIVNAGLVKAKARSDVESVSVAVALSLTDKGVPLTGTAADGSTIGRSTATGISGDGGVDTISNDGDIEATAEVDATSVSVSVAAQGASKGVALGVALSRATSDAVTGSSGIAGGADSDTISNTGLVKATATSTLVAGAGGLAAGGTGKGITLEGAAADGSTNGSASAAGITGDGGSDLIVNSGTIDLLATVDTTTVTVAVSANGAGTGLSLGIGLARATSEGHATGNGISGGDNDDTISNTLLVKSQAMATVVAGSGALAAGGTGKGLTLEGAAVDGSTLATASNVGLSGDQGDDVVHNDGTIDLLATADTTTVSVGASANGTGTGAALGVALSRATSEATANGTGISGGVGNDVIMNSGLVKSSTLADVLAVGVSAALGGAGTGVALEGAAADASTIGTANTRGISGGQGVDQILNEGTMELSSVASVASTSVSVSASGAGTGAGLGVALTRAGTQATATSTGISLGEGSDSPPVTGTPGGAVEYAANNGHITANATATADSVSVGVQLGITGTGLQGGVAMADASTTATAEAWGMAGAGQGDELSNTGTIATTANADADSTSVSVGLNVSLEGASLGATFVDAATDATAASAGIAGGAGDDRIDSQGAITTTALSNASGVSVSVSVGVSFVPLNAAVADMKTMANSRAVGIDGGAGSDVIVSTGPLVVVAGADATGTTVSVAPIGASLGSADVSSHASAVGLEAGTGDDSVLLDGATTATATSTATGTVVNVTLTGASGNLLDSADTLAEATATGVSAGAGHNLIDNAGALTATATAGVEGTAVTVGVTGAGIGAMGSTARATATGIQGGAEIDGIKSLGAITSQAIATTAPTSVGVTLVGASLGDNTTSAEAAALGIAGGAGDDGIDNGTGITVTATATTTAHGVNVTLVGDAEGDADVTATGTATGIAGNDGADQIWNHGTITASATASATVVGDAWNVVGNTSGDSILKPEARAVGIDGGSGADRIDNDGDIVLLATTSTQSTSRTIMILAGAAGGDAGVLASSGAIGLAGNDGDDLIDNQGTISGSATATVNASSTTYTTAGAALGNSAQTTSEAFIIGISGGAGSDTIRHAGAIDIAASATTNADGDAISIFGSSSASDGLSAQGLATGVNGGEGDDTLENLATVKVAATTNVAMVGSSFTFGGSGSTGGSLAAVSTATGMDGGTGRDTLSSSAAITVSATSNLASSGGSDTVFGTSEQGAVSGSFTSASGMAGGGDDDSLSNLASLDVTAGSLVTMNGSNYTFGGTGTTGGTLAATTAASGISGGDGADRILNKGNVTITATSQLNSLGESETTFGTAAGATTSGAFTDAVGISGGYGDDSIEHGPGAMLEVSAATVINSTKSSYTFGGTASAAAALEGISTSVGIDGGGGGNLIRTYGDVTAAATSTIAATGGTKTTFGGTTVGGAAASGADAMAVSGGEGADSLFNSGLLTASAASTGTSVNSSDAGWLVGDGDTVSTAWGTGTASGMSVGEGANDITNDGGIMVTATGTAYSFAYASAAHLTWDGDGNAVAVSTAGASAVGVTGGDGNSRIINNGTIQVAAAASTVKDLTTTIKVCSQEVVMKQVCHDEPDPKDSSKTIQVCEQVPETVTTCVDQPVIIASLPTYAGANGNGVSGDGRASATGTADVEAYGIKLGDGDNLVINNGIISVTASPDAKATVFADGDAFGDAIGSATAKATAVAFGVWVGNGSNEITNNGTLTVTAAPRAQARTEVSGGDICIWYLFGTWCGGGGDGIGTASAIFDARAVGVLAGNGDNLISNSGTMTVVAQPAASDFSAAVFSANYAAVTTSVTSKAVGIQAGDGSNRVVNTESGVIDVRAYDLPISYSCTSGPCTRSFTAVGIQTGSGDDLVVNSGTIITSVPSGQGIGITTGAGGDTVMLGNGSSVAGSIDLGVGDDTLHLVGSPLVTGTIVSGPGSNSLVFEGAGAFANPLTGFVNATKLAAGSYSVPTLSTMQRLEVRGGALRVNSDYQFASDGTFLTRVNGDGSSGQLIISGTGLLDGALSVSRGRGPYLDGTTYDVVQASNGLEGTFSTVILPKPSFLLRFKEIQHADTVQIEVLTKSFWTVAVNSMQKYIAEYLDRILPTAGGDLANVIGEFQGLPESGYSQAFSSLSPDFYARTADVSRQAGVQYLHTLSSRMDGIRANGMTSGSSLRSDIQPEMAPLLAYSGADASIAQLFDGEHGTEAPQRYGLWIDGFGKWGERDGDSGHYGYNYDVAGGTIGLDFLLNKKVIVGVSGGYSSADIDLDDHAGDGTVRSGFGSIYGSYFTDRYFLETALSYSRLDCESKRGVVVGELEGYARSDHNGDAYSAYFGGGYNIAGDQWLIQPLASLFYTYLDEDGFQETGAGGVSLAVDGRSTESLESEVGLRLARAFTSGTDTFVPELRVAWKYDFGLDDQVITAAFAGSPNTTFSVAGQDIDRNGIVLGAGISFMQKGGFSARLRYEGELREDYRSHGVLGELRYAF